jgi:two-component system, cell cycle sensor histidine kinase and response regulator CckA
VSLPSLDQTTFQRRLGAALATPVLLLLLMCVVFLALIGYLQLTARWVTHSDEVLARANRLERLLVDRESGLRGYLVTGDPIFLDPYRQAHDALPRTFDALGELTADDTAQTARLADLRAMADRWDQYAQSLIARRESGDASAPAALHLEGKQQMDALRADMAAFLTTEIALRDQRSQTAATAATVVVGTSVLFCLGLGAILAILTLRNLQGLAQSYGRALAESQAQAAELASIRRYNELLLNSAGEGIYGLDKLGHVTFVNTAAAHMIGWTPAELLGQTMHDRLHHTYADGTPYPLDRCPVTATLRDGTVQQVANEVFWRKDNTPFPVEYLSSPITDGGVIAGAVVTFRDISDRRRLEAQLVQAQKMESVGRLAGGIAHDFNNLLTTIVGCVDLARDALPDGHPAKEDLSTIQDATERASALTRQLLMFARRQAIAPQTFNLNDLIRDLDKLLRRTIGADIALVIHPAPDLGLINADRNQIEQVLLNLALNARDAMANGGKLTIETANADLDETYAQQHLRVLPGPYVMLAVSDTGQGMSPEVQAQIFEPFFTTKESGKGTGLGLSTSYGIVQQHGGAIWVYSEVGHGATFKIYLPRTVPAGAPAGASLIEPLPWGSETILLVEDEEAMRTLTARVLREHGYAILEAATGDAGLRLAQAHAGQIDLLLADVMLPEIGGTALAGRLAELRPGIKTLFVSGYPAQALVHQGRLAMDAPVLHKPFAAPTLLRSVRAALDS